ncbi:MAG: T9SS type A sorting domain-containing protein [Chitinophagaceae bacterium]
MKKLLASVVCLVVTHYLFAQLTPNSVASSNVPGPNGRIYFYQYKPPHYNNTDLFPLIISLHGGGEGGPEGGANLNNVLTYGLPNVVNTGSVLEFTWQNKTEGFIMLAPQTTANLSGDWPLFYVDEMIAYGIANLRVDPNRVFLTGYSLGGKGVWKYATSSTANASKLAGIIPAAAIAIGGANFCNIASSKVATWVQHGGADNFGGVSEAIAYTNAINACSPVVPAVDSIFPDESHGVYMVKTYNVDNVWRYPNVFQWMLKVNRNLNPATNQNPVPVVAGASVINLTAPVIRRNLPILDGSASYDPDDIIMDYLWEQTGGPTNLLPNSQNRQWPTVKIPAELAGAYAVPVGSYQFTFRVKDYLTSKPGHTQFVTKTINVSLPASGHAAPATDAGEDVILANGQTSVQRSGNALAIYGGSLASFNWKFISGPQTAELRTFNGSGVYPGGDNNVSFTNMTIPGVYTFEFSSTNNFGDVGTDQFTITRLGALPVNYSYIKGSNAGSKNIISWATTAEVNSDRFEILRSSDGVNFSVAGTITSRGGATLTEYTFDDSNAPLGISYYRLAQIDKDGKTALSKIVSVNNRKTGIYIEKYPNPVHDNLTVTVQGNTNGSLQVIIADMQGKTLMQQQWQKDQSLLKKVVNVNGLKNGVYQMIVSMGQEKMVSSFVKY